MFCPLDTQRETPHVIKAIHMEINKTFKTKQNTYQIGPLCTDASTSVTTVIPHTSETSVMGIQYIGLTL